MQIPAPLGEHCRMKHSTTCPDSQKVKLKQLPPVRASHRRLCACKKILSVLGVAAFWLLAWQLVYWRVGNGLLVVSPAQVATQLMDLAVQRSFWQAIGISLLRIGSAFLLGMACGTLLAVATSRSALLRALLTPVMGVVRATPVASFIILALLWMGKDGVPSFMAFLMVLPVVWGNVAQGISRIDPKLLQMARAFGFGTKKTLLRVAIPSVMPYFMAASTAAMGMAWKAGIAAEVLAMPRISIGIALYNSKVYLETADLFAWTTVVILLSLLIEKAFVALIRRIGKRWNVG